MKRKEAIYVVLEKGTKDKIDTVNRVLFSNQSTSDYVRKSLDQCLNKHLPIANRKMLKLNGGIDGEQ